MAKKQATEPEKNADVEQPVETQVEDVVVTAVPDEQPVDAEVQDAPEQTDQVDETDQTDQVDEIVEALGEDDDEEDEDEDGEPDPNRPKIIHSIPGVPREHITRGGKIKKKYRAWHEQNNRAYPGYTGERAGRKEGRKRDSVVEDLPE